MTSIFRRALGADFDNLHPEMQRRFDVSSADYTACIGVGTMDEIWHGRAYVTSFLRLGARRNILFPETGSGVPFRIENYAYADSFGRETVTFVRTFEVGNGRRRRFDATMAFSEKRGVIVDYVGTHQHIAVDLELTVREDGGLRIRSGEQRLHEGRAHVRLPDALSGVAEVNEYFDDREGCFRITVDIRSPWAGPIFGYSGRFDATYVDTVATGVPAAVKPYREEIRD